MGDPPVSLALLRLQCADSALAVAWFEPVLEDAVRDEAIGALRLEPPAQLARLLALVLVPGLRASATSWLRASWTSRFTP